MVITCSAPGCSAKKESTNGNSAVLFHRFPLRKPDVLAKWVKSMKNPNFRPTVKSYLCSAHFSEADYELKPNVGKHLRTTAVPTIFEKKKPGRKKKILSETEIVEDIKENENEEESIVKNETEETIEEEYLESNPNDKEEFSLAEIIGNQEKETLQILIVGENGKIVSSDYILKKELFSDGELKPRFSTAVAEEIGNQDSDDESGNELKKQMLGDSSAARTIDSSDIPLKNYKDLRNQKKIKRLETTLLCARKKVKVLQHKCKKMNKKLNRLKILLKLLVLKRGRGEKNLKELLEEYEKELEDTKVKVKEEGTSDF